MATARVNMKEYYKQQKKKGSSGISKPKSTGGVNSKTPSIGPHVVQPPALLTLQDDYDADEEVLRQFDMNMAYGPCIGLPRLDRWNRACKLGMNPPKEVEKILKSGKVQTESLWDGRV